MFFWKIGYNTCTPEIVRGYPSTSNDLTCGFCFIKIIMEKKRVNVYIDWFNVYHVLKKHISKSSEPWEAEVKWCNLRSLSESYLKEDEELWEVYFFTADSWIKDTKKRWINYQKALNEYNVTIIKWQYSNITKTFIDKMKVLQFLLWIDIWNENKDKYIPKRLKYKTYEEKRTDVNIAIKILEDAFLKKYDKAIIMSGDSDIIPSIESVKKNFPKILFTNLWIVGTKWQMIKNKCDNHEIVWYKKMKEHMFNYEIETSKSEKICIPEEWKNKNT